MRAGILGTSEYSGWDSQAEATRCLKQAYDADRALSSRGFVWLRASDIAEVPRHALTEFSKAENQAFCVLGDIADRLPHPTTKMLEALSPSKVRMYESDGISIMAFFVLFRI